MASALEQFVNSVRQLSAQGEQPGGSGGPGLDGLPLRRHPGPGLTWRAERSGWAALEASACLPDCRVSPAFIPLWGALRVPPQGPWSASPTCTGAAGGASPAVGTQAGSGRSPAGIPPPRLPTPSSSSSSSGHLVTFPAMNHPLPHLFSSFFPSHTSLPSTW